MSRGASSVSDSTSPPPSAHHNHGKSLTLIAQAEKINNLFGEFKGLRAQFTEFRKQIVSASEMKAMKEEMRQVRGEIAAAREAGTVVRQCQQAMEQQSSQQVQIRQQLELLTPMARQTQGATQNLQQQVSQVTQEVQVVKKQVDPVVNSSKGLQEMAAQIRELQAQAGSSANLQQEQAALRQKNNDALQQLQRLQSYVQELSQRLLGLDGQQSAVLEAKREVERLRQEHGAMRQRNEETAVRMQEAIRSADAIKMESKRTMDDLRRELSSIKSETSGNKGLHREQQAHMRRLEERTRGLDELGRLKATVDTTGSEFWTLKKQLYDSGLLAPKKDPEPEASPVGTLELGEDVFTARLLIRLGMMKHVADEAKAHGHDDSLDWVSDDDSSDGGKNPLVHGSGLVEGYEEDVTGLAIPEIEEGGSWHATVGWVVVCVLTLFLQVLIVGIMLIYGIEAGDDCIKKALPPGKWYMLHVSKAAATLAAGMLMGKELMDVVNLWMVSQLLEKHMSMEVAISAVTRILLILFIAAANVIIFMTMTSPADVWINMTALGFIGEISIAVLDVAKKGVFGHHICKAVTSVNYSLNFMTDYPWWFAYARGIALSVASSFIAIFAIVLYYMPDNICLEDGSSEASNLLDRMKNMVVHRTR